MASDSVFDQPSSSRIRKQYDVNFKLDAVQYAEKYSKSAASRHYRVDRARIREWVSQKPNLLELRKSESGKNKRLKGAGRPLKDKELDNKIFNWIVDLRRKKLRVSRTMIQYKAKTSMDPEFQASNGWLQKFLIRHNYVNRRSTTKCQKPPEAYQQPLVNFILFVSKLRRSTNYNFVYAADETAVFIDESNGLTVEEKGAKEVPVLTTGHDKMRVTVMLTARSDGYKCRPFVLLPRKRPVLYHALQASDVNWNAPFKASIRRSYEDWMVHGVKSVTKGGNPAAPPMDIYLQCIVTAWEALPKDLIIKSFMNCGLSIALDGSEDHKIHCFSQDGPIPTGRELLQLSRKEEREAEITNLLEEIDLSEDENNGYESETNDLDCFD